MRLGGKAEVGTGTNMGQTDQIAEISNVGGLIATALQISDKRRETLQCLRTAFLNSDTTAVYQFARQLCGIDEIEEPPPDLGCPVHPLTIRNDVGGTNFKATFGEDAEVNNNE
jgi:hypothetical protein